MNTELAQKIIDSKASEAAHIFIDENGLPRDKHIEILFGDTYNGVPLDSIFRNNFSVYAAELIKPHPVEIPARAFINFDCAKKWIDENIGEVTVRHMTNAELRREHEDEDGRHLRYVSRIKSPHARVKAAYAPSLLHAAFQSAVKVFRAEADKRLRAFLRQAMHTNG